MAKSTNKQRPVRQKKSDRIITSAASEAAIRIDMMMAPFTKAIAEADKKWGIDRLPELVSVDTASKWGMCLAKLNAAVDAEDVEKATQWTGAALRGLTLMDAEAEASGAIRASLVVWEVELNGTTYGIMQDGRSWETLKEQMPHLKLVTLREVAVALEWWHKHGLGTMMRAIEDAFPKAEIIRSKPDGSLDDKFEF